MSIIRRIRIPNTNLSGEKTYLDADYSSGTTLTVISNLGFADNYMVVVGEPGEEKTEAKDATGITGNATINISGALKFSHNKSTPIYKAVWDQVSIERQTTGGTWAEITASEIDWDKNETVYIDASGDDTHSYRFRFYNQFLTQYSEYSPTVAGEGFTKKQVGYMLQNVRKAVDDPDKKRVSDTEIIRMFTTAQDIIQSVRHNWWFLKVDTWKASNGITTEASTGVYSLATYTDFNYLERMRFNFNDGTDNTIYDLIPLDEIEFDDWVKDQDRTDDDTVARFKLIPADSSSDQGYFEVDPVPETAGYGTFYPEYWKIMGTLDDVADETDCPLPQILEDYASWKIEQRKGNETKAKIYQDLFYGANPKEKGRRDLTGIALLEQLNKNKGSTRGMPKQIWRRSVSLNRIFSERVLDRDSLAERYF